MGSLPARPVSAGLRPYIRLLIGERRWPVFGIGLTSGVPASPELLKCLETDLDELLNFLDCPAAHWRKGRTTNVIERAFREVRRRTRPMSCLNNSASVGRIIYGIVSHLNQSWEDKPLPKFTHNT